MMSKVILLTPAFLLRMVLARASSLCVVMSGSSSGADRDDAGGEQFQRVLDGNRMVERPAISCTGAHHFVKREGDRTGRTLDVRQTRVEQLAQADQGQLLCHFHR